MLNTKKNRYSETWIFYVGIGLTVGMMLLRDLLEIPINRYFFIILALVIFLFGKVENIYYYIMFITPIHAGLPYSYIIAIAFVTLIIKKKKFKINQFVILGMIIIIIIEIINGFRGEFSVIELLQFATAFLLLFFLLCDQESIVDCEKGCNLYILGFLVAVIDLWGQMLRTYSFNQILNLQVRFGNTRDILNMDTEGMLLSYNVNMLGGICVLCSMVCLLLISKGMKSRLVYIGVLFIASITGFLTLSRATIIFYILGIVLFATVSDKNIKRKISMFISVGVMAVLAYYVIINYFTTSYNFLLRRFSVSDITNGRSSIFAQYMDKVTSSIDRFLFGVGIQGYKIKSDLAVSCHNATQEVLVAWGIIGLLVIIICIVNIFWVQKKLHPSATIINYIPAFILFCFLQSSQGFSVRGNVLSIIVAISGIGIRDGRKGRERNEKLIV